MCVWKLRNDNVLEIVLQLVEYDTINNVIAKFNTSYTW